VTTGHTGKEEVWGRRGTRDAPRGRDRDVTGPGRKDEARVGSPRDEVPEQDGGGRGHHRGRAGVTTARGSGGRER
jgi:hypothetical protein